MATFKIDPKSDVEYKVTLRTLRACERYMEETRGKAISILGSSTDGAGLMLSIDFVAYVIFFSQPYDSKGEKIESPYGSIDEIIDGPLEDNFVELSARVAEAVKESMMGSVQANVDPVEELIPDSGEESEEGKQNA